MSKEGKCAIAGIPCPKTSNAANAVYCPLWAEDGQEAFLMENIATGETKVERCGARVMIKGMIEVIKASNRPAAAFEKVRYEIGQRLARASPIFEGLNAALDKPNGAPSQIEARTDDDSL
jgi:hypothetical protein